jgi:glycerol-3-phosphate O-acyltransferase/dihydroxyacetone phosphate acyltransferase
LWTGVGITVTLNICGANPWLAQGAGFACLLWWAALNVEPSKIVWEFMFSFADIFFREVGVRGNFVVPRTGPVIFAIAPHANQFLDPIVVGSTANRDDIGYITAAATFRRTFVGKAAKWSNCIPVERPQDLAKTMEGKASVADDSDTVVGTDTSFTKLKPTDILYLKGCDPIAVKEIIDDTHLVLKSCLKHKVQNVSIKAAPHVPQESFFKAVFDHLEAGKAVGVFPEGGSHDQTHFLELKPGVAMFCLGGSATIGRPVPVVPVGLNYFKGHRFHSRVFVDYGNPIYPSEELLKMYNTGDSGLKREATSKFLLDIREGLRNVTVQADDFHTLQLFWALRRLYVPSKEKLDDSTKQQLTRGFAEGYPKFKDNERVKKLIKMVESYTESLKQYGLRDYMVARRMKAAIEAGDQTALVDKGELLFILARRLALIVLWGLAWLPAGIASLPFVLIARYVAHKKAAEAVAKSSVKIAGRDVLATWKCLVVIGLWPTMHFMYTFAVYFLGGKLSAVVYFFFMPFLSFQNLKSQENMVRLVQSITPLILLMRNRRTTEELVMLREQCRKETCAVVEEVGWGLRMTFKSEEKDLTPMRRVGSLGDMVFAQGGSSPRA